MFQMSKQLFDQCWPAIAAVLRRSPPPRVLEVAPPAGTTAANEVHPVFLRRKPELYRALMDQHVAPAQQQSSGVIRVAWVR